MSGADVDSVIEHLAEASLTVGTQLSFAGRGLKLDSEKDGIILTFGYIFWCRQNLTHAGRLK